MYRVHFRIESEGQMVDVTAVRTRSARREATRQRVLDAAREVFAERGVFGGTVEDICDRAGFTRGAFYSNFADKADVLQALIEREDARLLAYLDAHFDLVEEPARTMADRDATAAMAAIVERLLGVVPIDRQFSLIRAELETHAVRDAEVARVFRETDARFRARIVDYLERGIERLGRSFTIDTADLTDSIIAIVEGTAYRALLVDGRDPTAIAREILPVLLTAASRPVPRSRGRRGVAATR